MPGHVWPFFMSQAQAAKPIQPVRKCVPQLSASAPARCLVAYIRIRKATLAEIASNTECKTLSNLVLMATVVC
jgi:hypothetical protein